MLIKCRKCGYSLPIGSTSCRKCGMRIDPGGWAVQGFHCPDCPFGCARINRRVKKVHVGARETSL